MMVIYEKATEIVVKMFRMQREITIIVPVIYRQTIVVESMTRDERASDISALS